VSGVTSDATVTSVAMRMRCVASNGGPADSQR
jgi:hypothetical protein